VVDVDRRFVGVITQSDMIATFYESNLHEAPDAPAT
jgi:CBS-domain-containing membrane protein